MSEQPKETFRSALLVEDEPSLSEAIRIALRKMRIEPLWVTSLKDAREAFEKVPPELILLDRSLPDGEGLEWCRTLRKKGYAGMILVLTAKGDVAERVTGLDSGADDYLPKPFSWNEFEARVKALARRKRPSSRPEPERDALWRCDPDRNRVLGPKGWVELTALEYKLVSFLIESEGKIIPREELLKKVWGFQLLPRTRTVDLFMSRIRKWFERDPENPRYFVTVRGSGYRFDREGSV